MLQYFVPRPEILRIPGNIEPWSECQPKDLGCEVRNLETQSVLGPCANFAKCKMLISRGENFKLCVGIWHFRNGTIYNTYIMPDMVPYMLAYMLTYILICKHTCNRKGKYISGPRTCAPPPSPH